MDKFLDNNATQYLLESINSSHPVSGFTHNFYRYPARFSPEFVRATIKLFTEPGDIVLDPFMGGGTTLVEAYSLGRLAIGADINSLATFVARVKTTPVSRNDVAEIQKWTENINEFLNLRRTPLKVRDGITEKYKRNLNSQSVWAIRRIIELAIDSLDTVKEHKHRQFIRCAILRTSQWALDCRETIPTVRRFREVLASNIKDMLTGMESLNRAIGEFRKEYRDFSLKRPICICRSAIGIEEDQGIRAYPSPRLVLTSPPYPGVHVLYHRWQVRGRKETPAPFWITNCLDGNGASYFTFGDRKQKHLAGYFRQVQAAFSSISAILDRNSIVVQLLSFSDPSWQLPRYLEAMENAGLREVRSAISWDSLDHRLWRLVPNRKWYATYKGDIASNKEVVFFHRLK